jgi:hypothetical protein
MTRAKRELVLATKGEGGDLALDVEAAPTDLCGVSKKVRIARAGYLDCDPSHVVLTNRDLAAAQRIIARLREGDDLDVEIVSRHTHVSFRGQRVGTLSAAGQAKLDALRRRARGTLRARVHEIFVHLPRDASGKVRGRILVTLPTLRLGV